MYELCPKNTCGFPAGPDLSQSAATETPDLFISGNHVRTTFKNIDDALWKESGCTTELDYTEQTSWLLFLKNLNALEQDKAKEAALDAENAKVLCKIRGLL
jgi:hypothetical protein